ncbi:CLUMA_CG013155, isoform A [Clunio marinus]|uniref:CLUMA_CG013155, isoform A n=1 Tax=Clunio marinus TaxID=568069 RepID=A0A1J1IJY2_9DIPT|nr:CLUMA_CG013155, isoform A [Clunio marinus]
MEDEKLLIHPYKVNDEKRKVSKRTKVPKSRAANALFCGVALGFVFSFLVAYSGIIKENNDENFFLYEALSSKNENNVDTLDTTNLVEFLRKEVRVLCAVMTNYRAVNSSGEIILNTWGKRCNLLLFFTERGGQPFNDNHIVLEESDEMERTRAAYKYIYTNHLHDFDWVLKTTEHSFIILENLRHMLYQYNNDWPLFIGMRFLAEDYMIGDYVMSKRSFVKLLEDAFTNPALCGRSGNADKGIANCLSRINTIKIDGVDELGRGRFFESSPENALFPEKFNEYDNWYWHKLKQGEDCCSDRLIAVQGFSDLNLYYMEYFIYKVHVFGRHRNPEPLPRKFFLEEVVKENT